MAEKRKIEFATKMWLSENVQVTYGDEAWLRLLVDGKDVGVALGYDDLVEIMAFMHTSDKAGFIHDSDREETLSIAGENVRRKNED